jgi:hypothetical protein
LEQLTKNRSVHGTIRWDYYSNIPEKTTSESEKCCATHSNSHNGSSA